MKMELNLPERLHLLGMLPKEGNIVTMRSVKKLLDTLALTDEEIKVWDVKTVGTNVKWKPESKTEKSLDFTDVATGIIKLTLKKLAKEEKITLQTIGVFDKFIPEGEPLDIEETK